MWSYTPLDSFLIVLFAEIGVKCNKTNSKSFVVLIVIIYLAWFLTEFCLFVQIAYESSHTREFCSKLGRELLAIICARHPTIISFLLHCTKHNMEKIGVVISKIGLPV